MNPHRINDSILPGDFCRVTCTRPGYYIKPSLRTLDSQVDSNGNCIVSNLTVGRRNFGRIHFLSPVNVANLNIDEIVFIEHKEVVVYPQEKAKPQPGEGLNCPAEITLEQIWPCGKPHECYNFWQRETDYYYKSKVKDTVVGQGAEFISYNEMSGELTFKVSHFSKYSCDIEEDEDELPPPSGLGGIPLKSLQQQEKIGGAGISDSKASISSGLVTPSRPISGPWDDVCDLTATTPRIGDYGNNCENATNVIGKISGVQQTSSAHACLPPFRPVLQTSGSVKSRAMKDVMSVDEFMDEEEFLQPSLPKRARGQNYLLSADASSDVFSLHPSNMDIGPIEQDRSRKGTTESQMEFTVTNVRNRPVSTLFPKKEVVFATANQPADLQEDLFSVIKRKLPSGKFSGAPRVCFAPNGSFVTVTNRMTEKGFQGQTNLCQLTSYFDKQDLFPLSGPYRNLLNAQLMLHLKQEGVLFKQHMDVLKDQLKKTSLMSIRMSIQAEIVIWELCDILWPAETIDVRETTDRGFLLTQRAKLSNWFVNNGQLLFGRKYDQHDHSIFGLLRKGKVEEACEAACEAGNDMLAVLIASDPHLRLGSASGVDPEELEYFPRRMPEILQLCKGSLKLNELNEDAVGNLWNYDWLQYFALYIWFYGPVKSGIPIGIEKAIREFEEMMRQIIGDEEAPLPKFEASSVSNLCMHLLKFYSCTGYPLRDILCPRTWSRDCFEYKLSWLLMKNLECIGYPPDDELYSNVSTSFSSQLENIGLFQWAIFVARELPPGLEDDDEFGVTKAASIKNLHCYRLLERNLNGGDETLDMEKFLTFDLHIDEVLIYSVKLEKSYTIGRLDRMMGYLLKINEFQKAFNVFKSHLAVYGAHLIGNKIPVYTDNLQQYLSALSQVQQKIIGWDTHGKLVFNFIKVVQIRDNTIGGSLAEKVLVESAVVEFLEAVFQFKPSNNIERMLLLEMTMSAQKILQLMIVDKDTSEATKDKIKDCLNSFMEISVPQEYFSGLRAFISNTLA